MAPFLMSLVSDSDHWMFISSNGALTAGRQGSRPRAVPLLHRRPDPRQPGPDRQQDHPAGHPRRADSALGALLPALRGSVPDHPEPRPRASTATGSSSRRSTTTSGCRSRAEWMTSERFGFVRRAPWSTWRTGPAAVEVLDGIQNLLPAASSAASSWNTAPWRTATRRTSSSPRLASACSSSARSRVDRPEPSEALRVNVVWSEGLEPRHAPAFRGPARPLPAWPGVEAETLVRGRRGAYFLNAHSCWRPGRKDWIIVADVEPGRGRRRRALGSCSPGPDLRAPARRGRGARHTEPGADRGRAPTGSSAPVTS